MMTYEQIVKEFAKTSYCTIEGATRQEIASVESLLHVELPPELRSWLALCNGAQVGDGMEYYGISVRKQNNIMTAMRHWWIRAGIIPVANDGCGNPYVLVCDVARPRPVLFLEIDFGDTTGCVVASSLETFLSISASVYVPEGVWPDDRERLVALDPAITTIHGRRMVWDERDGDE